MNLPTIPKRLERRTFSKVGTAVLFAAVLAAFSQSAWLHDHANLAMMASYPGYIGIILRKY
jgi:hypothetical protein